MDINKIYTFIQLSHKAVNAYMKRDLDAYAPLNEKLHDISAELRVDKEVVNTPKAYLGRQLYGCRDVLFTPELCSDCFHRKSCADYNTQYLNLYDLFELYKLYLRIYVKDWEQRSESRLPIVEHKIRSIVSAIKEIIDKGVI